MDTTRNRSAILALLLRNATHDIRTGGDRDNALLSIDAIADELEAVAEAREPSAGCVFTGRRPAELVSAIARARQDDNNDSPTHSPHDGNPLASTRSSDGNVGVGEREPSTESTE